MFPDGLPLARPQVPDPGAVGRAVTAALESGIWTNGPRVRELEERVSDFLGVRHCVAVSSCTSGLMLLLRAADLTGDVVVPSFTFAATAHAVAWNGLHPAFADIDAETLTLDPEACARAVGMRTAAILATHLYGTPCDIERLEEVARQHGVRLFFDAAHAFGSAYHGRRVGGFGDAEVFSLSPTKILVAAEGGLITTNDDDLAERCRIGRDYGNPGDYDCRFVGLNGRMSELHAAVALDSFAGIDERIAARNRIADAYRKALGHIPGISFPTVPGDRRSTFKDLTILVEPGGFGMSADELRDALLAEGIDSRRYYAPAVHEMRAYLGTSPVSLPITNSASERALSLPLWVGMQESVSSVGRAIERIQEFAQDRSSGQRNAPTRERLGGGDA